MMESSVQSDTAASQIDSPAHPHFLSALIFSPKIYVQAPGYVPTGQEHGPLAFHPYTSMQTRAAMHLERHEQARAGHLKEHVSSFAAKECSVGLSHQHCYCSANQWSLSSARSLLVIMPDPCSVPPAAHLSLSLNTRIEALVKGSERDPARVKSSALTA
eukprot:1160435-Pelagomonas_calceolata.AAC.8